MMYQAQRKEMEALVLTGKRAMAVQAVSMPQPKPDEVLIEVSAAGICGSELGGFLGTNALRTPPLVMGHEASGVIALDSEQPLADGTRAEEGRRVTFNPLLTCGSCSFCRAGRTNLCPQRSLIGVHRAGAFAEMVSVPSCQCWPLPEGLNLAAGVMVEPMACGVRAIKRSQIEESSRVMILGAGPIGLCSLLAAREKGAGEIYVVEPSAGRRELAELWGADECLEPGTRLEDGFDLVLDAVGSVESRLDAFDRVKPGGRIVILGLHDEQGSLGFGAMVRNEIELVGSFAYVQEDFSTAMEILQKSLPLPCEDWLEMRSLDEGQAAFEELVSGHFRKAKIALMPQS